MSSVKYCRSTVACLCTTQFLLIILFAAFCKYDISADALKKTNSTSGEMFQESYPLFQDVHVMIFIGFGFLMTFLRRYGYSAVGFNFLLAAVIIQWGILCHGFFRLDAEDGKYSINILSNALLPRFECGLWFCHFHDWSKPHLLLFMSGTYNYPAIYEFVKTLMMGDIIAAVTLISFGAVLGKTSPIQLLLMGIIETALFACNEYLGAEILEVADAGGSIFVHAFGAYFGLAVSFVLKRGTVSDIKENELEGSSYQSDITAMIGSIFLWMFWPSFNAGLLEGNDRNRAIINTYLSLAACCGAAFVTSILCNEKKKFDMVHIQNATLAGGVCIGTVANMMVQPYGALLVGSFAGVLSTVGYEYFQGWLLRKIHLHDTCGVNNLHGMPGIASGLISALVAGLANEDTYGESLPEVFPAMEPGKGRSESQQAGYQLIGLAITLVVAITGGLFTGLLVRNIGKVTEYYDDSVFWKMPEDEEKYSSENNGTANQRRGSNEVEMINKG